MIKNNLRQRPYLLRGLDGVYRGKRLRRAVYPAIINYKAQGVNNMTIQVIDESHDYSMLLRYTVNENQVIDNYYFDVVDNTELSF